jgi:tyrosyl-tRNA synthetase
MRLFTDLPLEEIAAFGALQGAEINEAKKALADAATTMLHGADAARQAREAAEAAFVRGEVSADLPTVEVPRAQLEAGIPLPSLASLIGLTASSSEARRMLQGGGLRLNDMAETDANRLVTLADLGAEGAIKLAAGKKKIVLVRPV